MEGTPNSFAYLILLLWPVVAFAAYRALGPTRGTIVSLLGGYLLLPPAQASFELPLFPSLNRDTISPLAALTICVLLYRSELKLLPSSPAARFLLALFLLSPVATTLTNSDPIYQGTVTLVGMRVQESVSLVLFKLAEITPFLLARALLWRQEGQRELLWGIVIGTLLYSLPMLLEVRLSPQVNTWVYGFFQHSFAQMMREGGFRPILFLYHGLWVAFLVTTAVFATCILLRTNTEGGGTLRLALAGLWLFFVLILCKSLGPLVYTLAIAPVILLMPARAQVRLAVLVCALVFLYPVLRGAELVPTEALTRLAADINPDRAQSLDYRFFNEKILLGHAQERGLFGWGSWGRNHLYDLRSGDALTVADGRWIVTLGTWGWAGFVAEFGLLMLPVFLIWWRGAGQTPRLTAGLLLILAVNLVDMLPNATITPLTWLFAGALLGWAERREEASEPKLEARIKPAIHLVQGAAQASSGLRTIL